jgi:sugar-specific transcriptional regulator TrmB
MPDRSPPAPVPERSSAWQDLIEGVRQFGLSEKEAPLYLVLLQRGRATARDLAREVGLDRVLGYRILDSMRARGIVEITMERPRRFVATPPRALFERVLRDRREGLARDERLAHELPEPLDRLGSPDSPEAPRYQIVAGTSRVYEYFREMLGRAREEVAVLSTQRGLRDSFQVDLHNHLGPYLDRGGRFRLIVESDVRIRGLLERFERLSHRYPKAQVRQLSPQPSRVTIVDRNEALVFLVPDAHASPVEQIAIWTNHQDFVNGQTLYFNAIWETAGSGSLRPPPPATTPRSRPRRPAARSGTATPWRG